MDREVAIDVLAGRWYAVIETSDHRRPVNSIRAEARVEVVVGIRVVAEHEAAKSWRPPVPPNATKGELAVFPLSAGVAVFGATGNLPVLPPRELGIGVKSVVDQYA